MSARGIITHCKLREGRGGRRVLRPLRPLVAGSLLETVAAMFSEIPWIKYNGTDDSMKN